jgi:hypothetical protein
MNHKIPAGVLSLYDRHWLNGKTRGIRILIYCRWGVDLSLGMLIYGKIFGCELPSVRA